MMTYRNAYGRYDFTPKPGKAPALRPITDVTKLVDAKVALIMRFGGVK